jgi:hypothetical protein
MAEIRSEVPLLIAFVDLTRFGAQSQRTDDLALAETIDAYYEQWAPRSARPVAMWSSSKATPR